MSSIFNEKYVETTYSSKKSSYPLKFCKHIKEKYKIASGSKLLDIGCGNGDITKNFKDLGLQVHGIDISDSSKHLLSEYEFSKVNLNNAPYPLKNETFDFVFSKSVVEHMRDPDILIDESFRLLKKGGIFICMTPSWKHSFKEAFYIDHTHVTPFTRYSLKTACELSGFEAKCEYFYQLPLLWKHKTAHLLRFLISSLPLPYYPFSDFFKNPTINKTIRFSKEAMLLCTAIKK